MTDTPAETKPDEKPAVPVEVALTAADAAGPEAEWPEVVDAATAETAPRGTPLEEALAALQGTFEEIKGLTGSLSREYLTAFEDAIGAVVEHATALTSKSAKKK
jgi:hypothetical protein